MPLTRLLNMSQRWFYDQEYEEHVLMERAPDGIWRELHRVGTRLSHMLAGGDYRRKRAQDLSGPRVEELSRRYGDGT